MIPKYQNQMKIFSKKEKTEIEKKLQKQFGITEIPGHIIMRGEERLFLYQGSFNERQLKELENTLPVERVGIYFAKIFKDKTGNEFIRLSIEGSQILSNQITKNTFELNEEQLQEWMLGRELQVSTGKICFLIMTYKNNFLGTGKASELKISNFIPKSRRLKNKEN